MDKRLLPSFLKVFQQLKPGTYTEIECYKTQNFKRAIMVMNPECFVKTQGVYGVDAAHLPLLKISKTMLGF